MPKQSMTVCVSISILTTSPSMLSYNEKFLLSFGSFFNTYIHLLFIQLSLLQNFCNAVHIAVKIDNLEILKYLINETGVDKEAKDKVNKMIKFLPYFCMK